MSASISNFLICEWDRLPNPLREDLLVKPIEMQNGCVKVPKGPGLGIEINEAVLKKYAI